MYRSLAKLIILCISILILSGCSGTRAFKTNKSIVDRIEIYEEDRLLKKNPVNFIIKTSTNKKFLGIPVGKILYETSHPEPKIQFENWVNKKKNRRKRLEKWISKKQIIALSDYSEKFNKWLQKTGEAPAFIDSITVKDSKKRILQYYKNLGYYDVSVKTETQQISDKKILLKYLINPKSRYLIDSISSSIESSDLKNIYSKNKKNQKIKERAPFEIEKFEEERERLFLLFRNNGIYNFQQNSIQFTAAIDSTGQDLKIPVKIQIDNIQQRIGDTLVKIPYTQFKVKDVVVFIDNIDFEDNLNQYSDSIFYGNFNLFSKGKLKFNPKTITSGISIKKGELYSDEDRNLTYRYFTNLKNFKYPSINYSLISEEENALRASIYLSPKERFSLGFDLDLSHSNIQDFGIGLGGGLGIRNVFRGAELLELNIKNTLGASRDIAQKGDQFFNLFELGADLKLTVPRLLIPWVKKDLIALFMIPKTEIILGTSFQENIGLDKQFFKGVYQFDIRPDSKKRIQFKLIDLEFVNNRNLSNYFNVYKNSYDRLNQIASEFNTNGNLTDLSNNLLIPNGANEFIKTVLNNETALNIEDQEFKTVNTVKERLDRLSANNLILGSSFSFNINSQESIFDEKFYQLRWKV